LNMNSSSVLSERWQAVVCDSTALAVFCRALVGPYCPDFEERTAGDYSKMEL
jgi:hypothetical protein